MIMKKFILLFLMISGVYPLQKIMAQIKGPEVSKLTNQIVNSRKTSNDLLRKYSWTSRTEVLKSKKILNVMIEKNQFDQNGQLVRKTLNEQGAKMPKTFLIRNIAENEKENIEKYLFGLRDFLKKYSLPDIDQLRSFIGSAALQVIDSTHEYVFTGKNVEGEGDQLIWWVEDLHFTTAKIEVHMIYNKDIVYFTGTFTRLKNGLNYMVYAEALIPSKKMTLQLQNYDYIQE